MAELEFAIQQWLGAAVGEPVEDETLASLRITAGTPQVPMVEVEDRLAHTLRGAALVSHADQHVLPGSNAGTALQKLERAFAQELLCPWRDLDEFTDEHGTDDEAIEAAADYFAGS